MEYELTEDKFLELTQTALRDEEFLPYTLKHELATEYVGKEVLAKLLPETAAIMESLRFYGRRLMDDIDDEQNKIIELIEAQKTGQYNYDFDGQIEYRKERIKLLTDELDQIIIKSDIGPILREIINRFEQGNFERNLVSKTARGLSEVPYSDYETPTKAKGTLIRLFESMNVCSYETIDSLVYNLKMIGTREA